MPEDDQDDLTSRMLGLVGRAARRGLSELGKAADAGRQVADVGRHRLALREARLDLDDFWVRLGKRAFDLTESGELDHVEMRKAARRIRELKDRIAALEAGEGAPEED